MSALHRPYGGQPTPAVFRRTPRMGFRVGDTVAPFVMFRRDDQPADWQGGPIIVADPIPGSSRTLYEHIGAAPLTLTTGLLFRDADALQVFWSLLMQTGELWMNAAYTMRPPDRVWHEYGVDYAIFETVDVTSAGTLTFDVRGCPMLDGVVFEREDTTW